MITENLSTLKIHNLTKEQYERELAAGRIDENALYLTPYEEADLSEYVTKEYVDDALEGKQPVGDYALKSEIPTDYLTEIPAEYITETELNVKGYLTSFTESDPTVPAWAKAATKPSYTASEVGALPADTVIPTVPTNVSAFTNDAGYLTEHQSLAGLATETYANTAVSNHNTNASAHNDIRLLIEGLTTRLNTLADSDDTTLDQMSEIVAYIKSNKNLIDGITTNKVNVSDIVNNLTTNVTNKPLSAAQGVALKALIDAITVPTKVSELTNDSGFLSSIPSEYVTETEMQSYAQPKGNYLTSVPSEYITETELNAKKYLTSYTETDPTVPAWAKQPNKPTYTAAEVGALPADTYIPSVEGLESYINNTVTNQIAGKQDTITGTAGQFVVIGSDGKPTTKAIPYAEEATF